MSSQRGGRPFAQPFDESPARRVLCEGRSHSHLMGAQRGGFLRVPVPLGPSCYVDPFLRRLQQERPSFGLSFAFWGLFRRVCCCWFFLKYLALFLGAPSLRPDVEGMAMAVGTCRRSELLVHIVNNIKLQTISASSPLATVIVPASGLNKQFLKVSRLKAPSRGDTTSIELQSSVDSFGPHWFWLVQEGFEGVQFHV